MFEIGWSEMLVIAVVMIVVVGPKDLPAMLRTFGRTTTKLRSMAGDFRRQFDEAMREAELDDVKNAVNEARNLNPLNDIRSALNPLKEAASDIRQTLADAAPVGKPMTPDVPASSEVRPQEPLKGGPAAEAPAEPLFPVAPAPVAAPATGSAQPLSAAAAPDAAAKPKSARRAVKSQADAGTAPAAKKPVKRTAKTTVSVDGQASPSSRPAKPNDSKATLK